MFGVPNLGGVSAPQLLGLFLIGSLLAGLVIEIFFILTVQKALLRCSTENRAMSPGLVWLLLIPVFNLIWNFFVVINVGKSLHDEFQKKNIVSEPYPGKSIGLAYSILLACSIIPFIGTFTAIAGFVCWIIYWVKISGYSNQLASGEGLQSA